MSINKPDDIPYQLLGQLSPDSLLQGLPDSIQQDQQSITTACIVALYYSALSNLYIQSVLPASATELEESPRLKIALDRTYNDFSINSKWLSDNSEGISSSTAKQYYDEVTALSEDSIKNSSSFYSTQNLI